MRSLKAVLTYYFSKWLITFLPVSQWPMKTKSQSKHCNGSGISDTHNVGCTLFVVHGSTIHTHTHKHNVGCTLLIVQGSTIHTHTQCWLHPPNGSGINNAHTHTQCCLHPPNRLGIGNTHTFTQCWLYPPNGSGINNTRTHTHTHTHTKLTVHSQWFVD